MLFFLYYFWRHWDNSVIRGWAYFYGASMIIAMIWLIFRMRRDTKDLERQIATGDLWDIKPPPKR